MGDEHMRLGPTTPENARSGRIGRRLVWALPLCLLLSGTAPAQAAPPDYVPAVKGSYRLLFEIDGTSAASWKMTMGALNNIIKRVGVPPAHLEVLVWGPGLRMLFGDRPQAIDISALQLEGVRFAACGSSMRQLHIKRSRLTDGVTVVPRGMSELVKRHNEGWTEVKM